MRLRKTVVRLATTGVAAGTLAAGLAAAGAVQADAATLAPLVGGPAAGTASTGASVVPGSYIVVLKDAASARASASRSAQSGATITHTYSKVFPGYSAQLSASELTAVRQDPAVKYVQRNTVVQGNVLPSGTATKRSTRSAAASTQKNVDSWGLDRVDQRNLPVNGTYTYNSAGANVNVYVVSGGVYADHPDFGGRIRAGVDEIGSTNGTASCNPFSTHVAGIIGGQYYGVAKSAVMTSVRVLACDGTGTTDSVVAGLDWIVQDGVTGPKVVDLSLTDANPGGNAVLDDSAQTLIGAGITVVAEAGDGTTAADACGSSPGNVPGVITVAASTAKDRAAPRSNFGTCVDFYAPGDNITSDVPGPANGEFWINEYTGSGLAAAFTTGTAALYLQRHPAATPAEVASWLSGNTTKDKISGISAAFPHDLLFSLEALALPTVLADGDRFDAGENLVRGQRLYSTNNKYFLALRSKDNWLALYDNTTGKVVWSNGHSAAWVNFHRDGYLTSYDAYGRRNWTSGTSSAVKTQLIINGKGYLSITRIKDGKTIWTTPH